MPSKITILEGDNIDVLPTLASESIDAVITDPPYNLGFMGKGWDKETIAFYPEFWEEVMRVMKPGAHLLAFGHSRTFHRLACAIEDAGLEYRDTIMWLYGTGFPKSLNISKALDKAAGVAREKTPASVMITNTELSKISRNLRCDICGLPRSSGNPCTCPKDSGPATAEAKQWNGWGTALKPAFEPIIMVRKPLSEKTVTANVLRYGTGALNVDVCRIETENKTPAPIGQYGGSKIGPNGHTGLRNNFADQLGLWPANVVHDGSEEVKETFFNYLGNTSRFFYSAKATEEDRFDSKHPTVKPTALMQWLCKLITPPNGMILDCFAGTGSTLLAAKWCNFDAIGIEKEHEYVLDIQNKLKQRGFFV